MLTLVYNEGGALGTSFGPSFYYLATSLVILAFVLYYIYSSRAEKIMAYPLAFIAGGALGNIIDRIIHKHVVDFIYFHVQTRSGNEAGFPAFNVADSAITVGAACLILDELLRVRRSKT